jgi:predicted Zn-dependent peptidase
MLRRLAELRDEDVAEDELDRARKKTRIWLEFSLDSPAEMIGWFGGGELLHPPVESFAAWLSRIESVTAADVKRVARAIFRREALVACAVGPLGSGVDKKLQAAIEGAL